MSDAAMTNQPENFDLSLQLDPDVIAQRLEAAFQHHLDKTVELLRGFGRFQKLTENGITDDETAGKAAEFLKQLRDYASKVDKERDAAKRPIDTASRVVQGFFKSKMIDLLLDAAGAVERAISSYSREKIRKAQQAREEEAQRERDRAAALAREAEQTRDPEKMAEAVARDQNAETIAASATAPELARQASKIVSDQGVTAGTALKPWQVEVIDKSLVPLEYMMLNAAKAVGELRANKTLSKLAELTDEQQPIAGLRFFRETRVTVR